MARRLLRVLVLPVVLVSAQALGGGCSLMVVAGPPPPDKRTTPLKCSTGSVAPAVDILLIGLQVGGFIQAASGEDSYTGLSREAGTFVSLALAAVFTVSAITGIKRMNACVAAQAAETGPAEARAVAAAAKAAGEAAAAGGAAASQPTDEPSVIVPAVP